MIPKTVGREYNTEKIVSIQCIKNDTLKDIEIKDCCFLLLFIHEGSAYFQVGDIVFEATGPCFVCFDEREQPKIVLKNKLKCDAIYFQPQFLNVNMTFERIHSGDYEQLALCHDMFLLKPFTDDDSDVLANKIRNPYLKNAVIYIESHYHEKITLESITKAVAINHSTLTRVFKSELGMTPIEYLWQYRITVAKKCLAFTNLPIKEIAMRCGFKTVQHFSRKFEMCTKHTPAVYRELAIAERKKAMQT